MEAEGERHIHFRRAHVSGCRRGKNLEDHPRLILSKRVMSFFGAVARAVVTEVENPKDPATGGSAYLDSVFDCKVS